MLLNLVQAGNSKVDAALAYKGRDVGSREEDQRDGEVLDEGDVEAVLSPELDVCAFEKVKGSLLESALCEKRLVQCPTGNNRRRELGRTLGHGEQQSPL